MHSHQRRRLLRSFGALAAAGAVAGCTDGHLASGDGGDDDHEYVRENDVVDYPAMADGVPSVDADERLVEYEEPEATFDLDAGYRGESADDSELLVSRDLSVDTMAGFVAPVYDPDGEAFVYHVFANEAFVGFADWNVLVHTGGRLADHSEASFERLQGTVHGFEVRPGAVDGLVVADETAEGLETGSSGESSGISLFRRTNTVRTTSPNVAFAFDYDAAADRLEVVHEGGDSVSAAALGFHSDAELTVVEDFEGTVTAGDTATVLVPSTASVRIVWEHRDRNESATLARWTGPDA